MTDLLLNEKVASKLAAEMAEEQRQHDVFVALVMLHALRAVPDQALIEQTYSTCDVNVILHYDH